jgi:hypothetical protein
MENNHREESPLKLERRGFYIKHFYWLTKEEGVRLGHELEAEKIKLKAAKGVVCTPLDPINRVSIVSPDIWSGNCSRQGSWYRASPKNGLYLVVSAFELRGYEEKKSGVITRSPFKPPQIASEQEKELLLREPEVLCRIPEAWTRVSDTEKKIYVKWAQRLGSESQDFQFLYLSHTANHGNFIKPHFFIEDGRSVIPYSIDRSAHLCSSCLELFQILGSQFRRKLVAPCPGATLFARLEPDVFLMMESPT